MQTYAILSVTPSGCTTYLLDREANHPADALERAARTSGYVIAGLTYLVLPLADLGVLSNPKGAPSFFRWEERVIEARAKPVTLKIGD